MASTNILGPARSRVDGPLKVTGQAKYAVEFRARQVRLRLAGGEQHRPRQNHRDRRQGRPRRARRPHRPDPSKRAEIETDKAARDEDALSQGIRNEERLPLADNEVHYAGQYVALVVAQTIEQARYAASLVRVSYAPETPMLTMQDASKAKKPKKKQDENIQLKKGDVEPALANQNIIRVHQTYVTPTETHNPIETSGTIAAWEGEG